MHTELLQLHTPHRMQAFSHTLSRDHRMSDMICAIISGAAAALLACVSRELCEKELLYFGTLMSARWVQGKQTTDVSASCRACSPLLCRSGQHSSTKLLAAPPALLLGCVWLSGDMHRSRSEQQCGCCCCTHRICR